MDWLCGLLTLGTMWLVARKRWQGWAVGIARQAAWAVLIWQHELWGLVPVNVVLLWIYSEALVTWRREELNKPADAHADTQDDHPRLADLPCGVDCPSVGAD